MNRYNRHMLPLLLILACKTASDADVSGEVDTACTLYCPDLDGDGVGDLVFARCWPVCRTEPPRRTDCAFTTNCPR